MERLRKKDGRERTHRRVRQDRRRCQDLCDAGAALACRRREAYEALESGAGMGGDVKSDHLEATIVGNNRNMNLNRRISVAPMMDWTDRHCRYYLRGFASDTLLYTEMITTGAVLRGDREKLLRFDAEEHPVALQLGGSNPADLASAARIGADIGYDEINLNCGCPSDRVHSGAFGACLMKKPSLVAECVAAMRAAVSIPVTVKLRIGVVDGAEIGGEGLSRRESAREAASRFGPAELAALEEFVGGIVAAG